MKPLAEGSIPDHLRCVHSPSFDDFIILLQGTHKFLSERKESLLIKWDKIECNNNISSAPYFI